MAQFEQRDNSFSMFLNDRKDTEKHPDFTGTLVVDGVHYFINCWKGKTRNGDTYLNGSIKKKEPRGGGNSRGGESRGGDGRGESNRQQTTSQMIDDEIPF